MTVANKRPSRHPKFTTAYRVKNWAENDKALLDRDDITLCLRQDDIGLIERSRKTNGLWVSA